MGNGGHLPVWEGSAQIDASIGPLTEEIAGTLIKLEELDSGGHAVVFAGRWIMPSGLERKVSNVK